MQLEGSPLIQSGERVPVLNKDGVFHFFGTRQTPESPEIEAVLPRASVSVRQVHGDHICRITAARLHQCARMHLSRECMLDAVFTGDPLIGDALITQELDVLLEISTADCVPILLFDPVARVVAAVHAGWRGTLLNLSAKVVREMGLRYRSDPRQIVVGVGPSIGACCYEVGKEVWREMERQFEYGHEAISRLSGDKAMLDLARLNTLQLVEAGVCPGNIGGVGLCTSCHSDLFFSYRRDGKKMGHMSSGIMLVSAD